MSSRKENEKLEKNLVQKMDYLNEKVHNAGNKFGKAKRQLDYDNDSARGKGFDDDTLSKETKEEYAKKSKDRYDSKLEKLENEHRIELKSISKERGHIREAHRKKLEKLENEPEDVAGFGKKIGKKIGKMIGKLRMDISKNQDGCYVQNFRGYYRLHMEQI